MHITIGILAHNEESRISGMIASLLLQSVFEDAGALDNAEIEIVVVPNGCGDATHAIAERCLLDAGPRRMFSFRVQSLSQRGKSNAWNELIHRIARPNTDVFVMIDADIEFGHRDTIANSVQRLLCDDDARVCVDLPLNNLVLKRDKSFFERGIVKLAQMKFTGPPGVAGSFYCARGDTLRQIWMPAGLPCEDGFLAVMVCTDLMRAPPQHGRVVRADNASHYYEGLNSLRRIFRHEVRLAIGTALNSYLCWDALALLTSPVGPGAGVLIRDLNDHSPAWYANFIHNAISNRRLWVMPRAMARSRIKDRFVGLRGCSTLTRVREFPLLAAAAAADLLVMLIANQALRKKYAVNFW